MLRTACCLLLLVLLLPLDVRATGDSLNVLLPSDSVFLHVDAFGEKVFRHVMEPGQTLESIAAFYGLTPDELSDYNPEFAELPTLPGDPIRIPVPNRSILRYPNEGQNPYALVPVFFVVGQGENLYRVSKFYFKMDPEELMTRNGLLSDQLNVGQLLHIGWMSIDGIPAHYREETGPFAGKVRALRQQFEHAAHNGTLQEQKGVAAWDAHNKSETELFALHRQAEPGSVIEILNPWMRERIYVRVIGSIPEKMHGEEVVVVLSPSAARLLGAVDPRFYAEVRYLR